MRLTPLRKQIIDIVDNSISPLSASDVLGRLNKSGKRVSKTTVYRDLDVFKKEKMVKEVFFNDLIVRYESLRNSCHHHLVCNVCGSIQDFVFNESKFWNNAIGSSGFLVKDHNIELFGVCKSCYKL